MGNSSKSRHCLTDWVVSTCSGFILASFCVYGEGVTCLCVCVCASVLVWVVATEAATLAQTVDKWVH